MFYTFLLRNYVSVRALGVLIIQSKTIDTNYRFSFVLYYFMDSEILLEDSTTELICIVGGMDEGKMAVWDKQLEFNQNGHINRK